MSLLWYVHIFNKTYRRDKNWISVDTLHDFYCEAVGIALENIFFSSNNWFHFCRFRKLFVILSSYTYMNTLRKIKWSYNSEKVVLLVRLAFSCCCSIWIWMVGYQTSIGSSYSFHGSVCGPISSGLSTFSTWLNEITAYFLQNILDACLLTVSKSDFACLVCNYLYL